MKKISIFMACMFAMSVVFAQQQTAILVHSDNSFNAYYGVNAFVKAMDAAQNGETINLSAGDFSGAAITKSLTIRGNGATGPVAERTYIHNDVSQRIADSSNSFLNIEGVYFYNNLYSDSVCQNFQMVHCVIPFFQVSNQYANLTFINCIVKKFNTTLGVDDAFSATCINSYIWNDQRYFPLRMINCVCKIEGPDFDYSNTHNVYQNCIIYGSPYSSYSGYHPYTHAQALDHCVVINTSDINLFGDNLMHTGTNNVERPFQQVFASFVGGDLDDQTSFALTALAQVTLLGSDSTQVGLYGGMRPWTDALTYPKISSMTVPHQTTGTGMLNVSVEIRQGE